MEQRNMIKKLRNKEDFWAHYKELDIKFNTHIDRKYEYLVNFSQIKNNPIHRWYYYQEGYSPELVHSIINHFHIIT